MTQTDLADIVEPIFVDARLLENEHLAVPCLPDAEFAKSIVPVGRTIPNAKIVIGENLADGAVGEIRISGPSLCSGYFRNAEMTGKKFVNDWYHTGDLGFKIGETVYVTGRMDDLIIVRGKNIYAHDIEAIASGVDGVKPGRSIAFGIDDRSGTQALAIAVEADDATDTRVLQLAINEEIQHVFGIVPADVCIVRANTLIKTTSGKISRSENRRRYLEGSLVQYR